MNTTTNGTEYLKTVTFDGVSYDLYTAARGGYAVRIFDVDSGNLVTVRFFVDHAAAEEYHAGLVREAGAE